MITKKLKIFIVMGAFITLIVLTAGQAKAVTYTGSLNAGSGGAINATDGWISSSTILSWTVKDVGSSGGYILWQYDYTFTVPTKDISHFIIEVSPNAVTSDFSIITGTSSGGVNTYDGQGNSNPNIPEAMRGIKFDNGSDLSESVSFTTTRAPIWGDFYSKDGTDESIKVTAWNIGFTSSDTDPSAGPSNGSVAKHILRPDTVRLVPEPVSSTLFIIGAAALGFRSFRKMKKA